MCEAVPQASQETVDEVVLRRLRSGDDSGLELLLETHGGRVAWWLRREFGDTLGADGVEDAMAEGLANVWQRHATFDPARGTLRAWYYTVCRNAALMALRKERPTVAVDPEHLASPEGGPAEERGPSAYVRALYRCIDALPRLQQRVVQADLQARDGAAPATELAQRLGTSSGAIYNARSKARKALKDCLERKERDVGEEGGER